VQPGVQVVRVVATDGGDCTDPADLTQHGRVGQHGLLLNRQRVQACGYHRLDGRGDRRRRLSLSASVAEQARVLLSKQRIAGHPGQEVRLDRGRHSMLGEQRFE
jgi:hypothetical protein